MVMEAPPSPQSVGREFVRQYYTLLNEAPTHLHRFYNHQSSFVHGGLDPPNRETSPVIGQKQIHQKIQQLNFRDCHAKITQVDSQATLGNGVVVQVTGELSNDGQPMRRFTQTFVLAAQSPKKYYVHNDIFRYQDEIISDEECDNDVRSEPDDEVSSERQVITDVQQISQPVPSYFPNTTPIPANIAQISHHQPQYHLNQQVPTVNGAIHPDENVLGQVQGHVAPAPQAQLGGPITTIQQALAAPQQINQQPQEDVVVVEEQVEEPIETIYNDTDGDLDNDAPTESVSNEPKTYANLLKSGNNTPYSSPPQAILPTLPIPPRIASPPVAGITPPQGQRNNLNNRGPRPMQMRIPRQDSGRGPRPVSDEGLEDRRRSQGSGFTSDVNQLFLGNLPHLATEDELREIFSKFGTILDLRVHSKSSNKSGPLGGGGPRAPPNYGFITYESQEGVQSCLQAKPIFYPKDDKNGTILNVEEKKVKERGSWSSGGRSNIDNNRGPRGDNQGGPRRSMGGGPGGPNRNNANTGPVGGPNRNNSYNRSGGPPNRGPNTYNRR